MSVQTMAHRRLRQREEARRSILDAAEALLVEQGDGGFSMRRLAERCGVTAATLYHYFHDKDALVEAVLAGCLSDLAEELRRVPRAGDPARDLRQLSLAFLAWGLRNPNHYHLLVTPRDSPPRPESEEIQAILGRPFDLLAGQGLADEEAIQAAKQSLWALLHGLILLRTTRPDEDWVPALEERARESMIRGLLPALAEPRADVREATP